MVVELAMQSHDHRIDTCGHPGIVVAGHRHRARGGDGLGDACAAAHEHPLAGAQQRGGRGGRRHHVAGRLDADAVERGDVLADGDRGGVGDEHHPPPGGAQAGDRLDRTWDRRAGEPHDPVQVAQHHVGGVHARRR